MGTSPDCSGSCRVKYRELGDSAGALTRLRRLAVVPCCSSASSASATAQAPGVGGIQLYGGPYGCVRAGVGFGSATLSLSLRGQILSVMRSFEEAVGVDITRRCWDRCSELTGRCDDRMGLGEFVRRGEGIESGDDMIFDVKEAGEGSDIGVGRRILRLARSAVVKLKTNKPNKDNNIPPRSRTSIVLDFFKNPNLPL